MPEVTAVAATLQSHDQNLAAWHLPPQRVLQVLPPLAFSLPQLCPFGPHHAALLGSKQTESFSPHVANSSRRSWESYKQPRSKSKKLAY